jgi:hypothetical protein
MLGCAAQDQSLDVAVKASTTVCAPPGASRRRHGNAWAMVGKAFLGLRHRAVIFDDIARGHL